MIQAVMMRVVIKELPSHLASFFTVEQFRKASDFYIYHYKFDSESERNGMPTLMQLMLNVDIFLIQYKNKDLNHISFLRFGENFPILASCGKVNYNQLHHCNTVTFQSDSDKRLAHCTKSFDKAKKHFYKYTIRGINDKFDPALLVEMTKIKMNI